MARSKGQEAAFDIGASFREEAARPAAAPSAEPGRAREPRRENPVKLTVIIDRELHEAFSIGALKEGRTRAAIVRELIGKWVDENGYRG